MKRTIALIAAAVCTALLAACVPAGDVSPEAMQAFFEASVVEVYEGSLFVEVTQSGNSSLPEGTPVYVSANYDGCPRCEEGDRIRVTFDSRIEELYPPRVPGVLAIEKTDDEE